MLYPKKLLIVCLMLALQNILVETKMTMKEMEKAGDMMKMVCIQKFKLPEEIASEIKNGKIPEDNKDVKCYIHCIFEMMQIMRKSKFLPESAIKQVELMMPDEIKQVTITAINECKNSANGIKDSCDAALGVIKCLLANNPQFVFP